MRLLTILLLITGSTVAKKTRFDGTQSKIDDETRREIGDMEFAKNVDVYPNKNIRPVPFGHIFREGYEDPESDVKQPIDMMELSSTYLKNGPYARELIEKHKRDFQVIRKSPLSPKDVLFSGNPDKEDKSVENKDKLPKFWNFAALQQRSLIDPPHLRVGRGRQPTKNPPASLGSEYKEKASYFINGGYGLKSEQPGYKLNFTTCDEFGRNAKFHPNDIVNIEWVPFYVWTDSSRRMGIISVARVHKFTYPTKKVVFKYKDEFGSHMNKTIDWEQPKLLLRDGTREYLLIAADRKGLFDAIHYHEIPDSLKKTKVQIPMSSLRLKIVDPYLALMYCNYHYATIMAVSGTEPSSEKDAISEAATLKMEDLGFPLKRNIAMEMQEDRAKRMQDLERERDKFLDVGDQTELFRTRDLMKV